MSDVHYVTSFRNLKISDEITGHVELIPGVNITNDARVKSRLLTPELASVAGAIEMEYLRRAPNLIFGEFDAEQFGELPPDKVWFPILMWIDGLFRNAWLLKDHAMVCDAAFFRVARAEMSVWSSSFLPIRPSFANGNADREIEMSISELKAWGTKNDLVDGYLHETSSSPFRFMMEKGYGRSGRAMRFVDSARSAPNLAIKIAHYCSALETLFTTESTELAHKLAERVAFFLAERGYDRRVVFTTVKTAYGVRSKLVHGGTLKPNQVDALWSLSSQCDDYLRSIVNAIFESSDLKLVFDSHNEAIEDYFFQLIFGPEVKQSQE